MGLFASFASLVGRGCQLEGGRVARQRGVHLVTDILNHLLNNLNHIADLLQLATYCQHFELYRRPFAPILRVYVSV